MPSTLPPDDPAALPRPSPRLATGRLFAGRYEVLDRIGEGGTAEVFRARDHRLDRIVAVKVLRPQHGQDPDARTRFAVEARSAAALAVPNIVPVYDFGAADDGSLFIVMRYIDGPSLRRVINEHGRIPAEAAVEIGRQVAKALIAAHGHGLIHRDVKPGNILLDAQGAAHLTDLGTVKALAGGDDLTRAGMIFGTSAYLSPEQATGAPLSPRVDLYALGVVLYEALSGQPPFTGDDPVAVLYRHAHEDPAPLRATVPDVDIELERLVMQCLEKDPDRRPGSAQEVATRLASIADRPRSANVARAAVAALTSGTGAAPLTASTAAKIGDGTLLPETDPADAPTVALSMPDSETVILARAAGTGPSIVPAPGPAETQRGIGPPPRRTGASGDSHGGGTVMGAAIVLLTIALVGAGAIWALQNLPDGRGDGVGGNPTSTPSRSTRSKDVAIVPSPSPIETPATTPDQAVPSSNLPPIRTAKPKPTPVPPQPTPVAPAPAPVQDFQVQIPDGLFVGGYDGPGSGQYHQRSASWVYGQGTSYHTMSATFQLEHGGQAEGPASLEIVGLDGENPIKNGMSIVLNGVTIYEGPNPLPDDSGRSGPGNWGSAVFPVAGEILQSENTLTIRNLEPAACTTCPKFVMVDYMVLAYQARP